MTIDELRISIGADSLGFLSVEGAVAAVGKPIDQFCVACFNGDYPIPIPEEVTKHALEGPSEAGEVGELATLATGQPRLPQG
jgi:amidophosphoribosyltransferase